MAAKLEPVDEETARQWRFDLDIYARLLTEYVKALTWREDPKRVEELRPLVNAAHQQAERSAVRAEMALDRIRGESSDG